ncbi:MAG: hypothetical protein IJA07_02660 [Agathobacter sp.]|nr:hypothetical protein [Agathobacter sp.]
MKIPTLEMIQKVKQEHEEFTKEFQQIKVHFEAEEMKKELEKSLRVLLKKYKENYAVFGAVFQYADDLMEQGRYSLGLRYLQIAKDVFPVYADDVTYYLRNAQYYIEMGDLELGKSYLVKLCCETVDNYEESIGFRELTHVWDKYKHLVEGKVPSSISLNDKKTPLKPEECTMQIEEILQLPKELLLCDLSMHLFELSGMGDCLNYLNRWEREVFYLDSFCTDINSDGIEHFVEYHGKRWKATKKAMEELGIENGVLLMDKIRNKMKKRIEDFEEEETFYYEFVEKELLEKLYQYVMEHKERFR